MNKYADSERAHTRTSNDVKSQMSLDTVCLSVCFRALLYIRSKLERAIMRNNTTLSHFLVNKGVLLPINVTKLRVSCLSVVSVWYSKPWKQIRQIVTQIRQILSATTALYYFFTRAAFHYPRALNSGSPDTKMAARPLNTREELSELVKRRAEIAVCNLQLKSDWLCCLWRWLFCL